jgi:hypothetical protein
MATLPHDCWQAQEPFHTRRLLKSRAEERKRLFFASIRPDSAQRTVHRQPKSRDRRGLPSRELRRTPMSAVGHQLASCLITNRFSSLPQCRFSDVLSSSHACELCQLKESAARLPCVIFGMPSFSANASTSGAVVKAALVRFQAARAVRPIVFFANGDCAT